MSVEIVERHVGIKLSENELFYIALYGSSNCTTINDNGRQVYARSWATIRYNVGSENGFIFNKATYKQELLDHQKSEYKSYLKRVPNAKLEDVTYSSFNSVYYRSRYQNYTYNNLINSITRNFGKSGIPIELIFEHVSFCVYDHENRTLSSLKTLDEVIQTIREGNHIMFYEHQVRKFLHGYNKGYIK